VRFDDILAEFVGAFLLVLMGCGAIVINDVYGGALGHLGVSMAFGMVVMAVICTIGDVSGAHINPAVTLGFWLARRMPGRTIAEHIGGQLAGAVAAAGVLHLLVSDHATYGSTLPQGAPGAAWVAELLLTFLIMLVIIHVAEGAKEKGVLAGIAIGGTVGLAALVGGPLTGASMNPARTLGPAIVSGQFSGIWIYMTAPLGGVALAVLSCRVMRTEGRCAVPDRAGQAG
jgi:aquaporin Z